MELAEKMQEQQVLTREALIQAVNRGERFKYVLFYGHTVTPGRVTAACFSQWFLSPFEMDGHRYPTAEHFMMAEKARLFQDEDMRQKILRAPSPGAAKKLGRQVRNFEDERWRDHRFEIVVRGNIEKFRQNPDLEKYLLETGNKILVEAAPRDRIWGIGMGRANEFAQKPSKWRGLNLLGFALMAARVQLSA